MKRNVLNSPRLLELKKKRRKGILNKILIALAGIVAIFLLSIYLARISSVNIASVEISGNKIVDMIGIKEVVQNKISGKYLWLFPKTNIFLYPKNETIGSLGKQFKRLKNIKLTVKNRVLQVSVEERAAKYTWCGVLLPVADVSGNDKQKCYFMDEEGYIFDEAPYFSGDVYFKFYGESFIDNENPFGNYFSKENFKELVDFRDTLLSIGLKPVALYKTADGDIDIFLSGGTSISTAPKIIIKADADFQNAAENLQAALSTEPLQSKFKNKYSSLQYIDLRFGNKVYDKFQ